MAWKPDVLSLNFTSLPVYKIAITRGYVSS